MDNFDFENKKKRRLKKEPIYIGLCVICLIIGACGGYFFKDIQSNNTEDKNSLYSEIAEIMENDFLDTTDSDMSLQERMINGMVLGAGDIHSSYLSESESQELGTTINGSFVGIGVTFTMLDNCAIILDVYQGTPAAQAGLLKGDMITHVEGTSVKGYTSDKLKDTIRGESGSQVTLRILRKGQSKDIVCTRGAVETSVAHEIRNDGTQKIGYLRITTFGSETADFIEDALKDFQSQNIENIVIDLRDNGGGYLIAAENILDLFIPSGEIMYRVENRQGEEKLYKASNRTKYTFKHGFLLVNDQSASASEVMTGALKEQLGYTVIGKTTYGKGTVQTQKIFSDSSVLKYTHAKWLTPKGTWVHQKGIEPDYDVDLTTLDDFQIGIIEKAYQYDQVDNQISSMQKMLKTLGFQIDREDGYFSKSTESALKDFEKTYGLKVNGIYEQNDATILLNVLAYHIYYEMDDTQYLKVLELLK